MALEVLLWCIAALLITGILALALRGRPAAGTTLVYAVSLAVSATGVVVAGTNRRGVCGDNVPKGNKLMRTQWGETNKRQKLCSGDAECVRVMSPLC